MGILNLLWEAIHTAMDSWVTRLTQMMTWRWRKMGTHHLDLLRRELIFCSALLPQVGGGVLDLWHALLWSKENRGLENSWIILCPLLMWPNHLKCDHTGFQSWDNTKEQVNESHHIWCVSHLDFTWNLMLLTGIVSNEVGKCRMNYVMNQSGNE